MSLLAEIAARADVPLEAVVGVLTREPVNDGHKRRVLEVLDDLDPEETRVVQRFALAAVHDALPPGGYALDDGEVEAEVIDGQLELDVVEMLDIEEAEVEPLPSVQPAFDPAPLVQLRSVLGELAEAIRELRHETDAERRERVDDLAVLIDLITKGWEGVDRRLGRMERQISRLEASPPPPRTLPPPAPVEPPPIPEPEPPPPPEGKTSKLRRRLSIIAALVVGIAIGALAAFDLPSRLDASAVSTEGTEGASSEPAVPSTAVRPPARPRASATSGAATTAAPPAAPATTSANRTISAPPPATQAPAPTATRTPPRTTAAPRPATTAPPQTSIFTPSRNWAWPPVEGADYYLVEFFRGGQPLYRARPTVPRLTLPASVEFVPGAYRWRVRPGRGAPAANRLDAAIVDSAFVVR